MSGAERTIKVSERPEVPWLSIVPGYGPMVPFVAGAAACWATNGFWHGKAVLVTMIWADAILAFLAGVRRSLSFRTEGGPALAQIATMFCLFVLALLSLLAIVHGFARVSVGATLLGYASLIVLDPIAARQGQAPLFFARLRPPQIAIAVAALAALLANVWLLPAG